VLELHRGASLTLAAVGGCTPHTLPATTVPSLYLPEMGMGNHPPAFVAVKPSPPSPEYCSLLLRRVCPYTQQFEVLSCYLGRCLRAYLGTKK